jgi:hypothetical protein
MRPRYGFACERPALNLALSLFVLVTSTLAPIHQARAFVPAVVPAIKIVASTGTFAWSKAAVLALVAAGASIFAVQLEDGAGNVAVNLRVNPKAPATVQPGWSAAPSDYNDPIAPATASGLPTYSASFGGGTCTNQLSIGACFDQMVPGFNQGLCGGVAPLYAFTYPVPLMDVTRSYPGHSPPGSCGSGGYSSGTVTVGTACPTGYGLSSGTCNLTDSSVVPFPSDSKAEAKVVAGVITMDPRDPDAAGSIPATMTKTDTQVQVRQGTATSTVKVNEDGSVTVTQTVGNGNGTSTKTQMTTAPADSGHATGATQATGVSEEQVIGEGTSAQTEENNQVNCPGCATEATQLANKALLQEQTTGAGVKVNETGTPTGTGALTSATTALDTHAATREAAITDQATTGKVTSWGWAFSFAFPSVSCSSWNLTFREWTKVVDWCGPLGTVRSLFAWFLGAWSLLYIWRRATGALGG